MSSSWCAGQDEPSAFSGLVDYALDSLGAALLLIPLLSVLFYRERPERHGGPVREGARAAKPEGGLLRQLLRPMVLALVMLTMMVMGTTARNAEAMTASIRIRTSTRARPKYAVMGSMTTAWGETRPVRRVPARVAPYRNRPLARHGAGTARHEAGTLRVPAFFPCAPGMARSARDGAVNRGAKANREVTRRCESSGGLGGRNP